MKKLVMLTGVVALLMAAAPGVAVGAQPALVGGPKSPVRESVTTEAGASAAATKTSSCPARWFCAYTGRNYSGSWRGGMMPHTCYSPYVPLRQSIINRTSRTVRTYSNPNCRGSATTIRAGDRRPWVVFASAFMY